MQGSKRTFRTGEEALEEIRGFLMQETHAPDRFDAYDKLERIVKSERALKRKVKRLEEQQHSRAR